MDVKTEQISNKTYTIGFRKKLSEHLDRKDFFPNCQNMFTPFELCREQIEKLKEYTSLKDKDILVFNIEYIEILIHDFNISRERIWFVTDCKEKVALIEHSRFKGVNVKLISFNKEGIGNMTKIIKKQFDVIIGNPPYQAPKERKTEAVNGLCGSILWDKFLKISMTELCKQEGYVCLVHPGQWRKPEHILFETIKNYNLKFIEIHNLLDGIKVFGANTGYDWYIIQNRNYEGNTVVKDCENKIFHIDLKEYDFIPNSNFDLIKNIVAKKEEKCKVIFSYSQYETRKPWMSKNKTELFRYPVIYGLTQKDGIKLIYSKENNGHFGVKKVIIPISAYTDVIIDYKGEYGLSQFAFGIEIEDEKEGENIKKALLSEKFKRVWNACEWIYNSKEYRVFKFFRKDFWKEFI